MSRWVVNTSPLIYLAHLDRLELIRQGADEVLIPPAVLRELRAKPDTSIARIEEAHQSWLRVEAPRDHQVVEGARIVERRDRTSACGWFLCQRVAGR